MRVTDLAGSLLLATIAAGCDQCGGEPSPFFGVDGVVLSDPLGGKDDRARAVAVQADGRIVVAGKSARDFLLVRYELGGDEDASFGAAVGTPGFVRTDVPSGGRNDEGKSLAIQADGKVVLAGISTRGGMCPGPVDDGAFAVARYLTGGDLDPTFAMDVLPAGIALAEFGCDNDEGKAVAISPVDGSIVVAGQALLSTHDVAVARFDAAGLPDPSFGVDGDGTLTTDDGGGEEEGNAVLVQADGKIVVAGFRTDPVRGDADFAVLRYTMAGGLDATFDASGDADGIVITPIGAGDDRAFAAVLQGDKTVVTGIFTDGSGHEHCALVRYEVDGDPDPTFGTGGIVKAGKVGVDDLCQAIAVQADGKLVVAGKTGSVASDLFDFLVMRFEENGAPDLTFGDRGDGAVVTPLSAGDDGAYAITVDPIAGHLIAVGEAHNGSDYDFAVVRYFD